MKKSLPKEDWDFSGVPKNELLRAWCWESARELEREDPGVIWECIHPKLAYRLKTENIWPKPYVFISEEAKKFIFTEFDEKRTFSFNELSEKEARNMAYLTEFEEFPMIRIHHFLVDWSLSKSKIGDQFRTWVFNHHPRYSKSHAYKPKGRHNDALAWLCDLAIYRVSKCGYTANQAQKLLAWVERCKSSAFSQSHYEDAQRITKERLVTRSEQLSAKKRGIRSLRAHSALGVLHGMNPFV